MTGESLVRAIEDIPAVEQASDRLQPAVRQLFESAGDVGRQVKDALHGTWLGHPLHAVLTDVPIGAWTTALVLDASARGGRDGGMARAADRAIAVGLLGALAAAPAGLTDWSETDGRAKKIGLVHGMMNLGAAALYATSLVLRKRNARTAGVGLSALAYLGVMVSAYLGGRLVYTERIGVDHAPAREIPDDFVAVLAISELRENEPRRVDVHEIPVVLVRQGEQVYALGETCAHLGGPLSEGAVEGNSIRCPWHGSRYSLADGCVLEGPSTHPQLSFDVRVRHGEVEIKVRPR